MFDLLTEVIWYIEWVTEEYIVIYVNLLLFWILWIKSLNVSLYDFNSTNFTTFYKIWVDFLYSPTSLNLLHLWVRGKFFALLVFVIPFSSSASLVFKSIYTSFILFIRNKILILETLELPALIHIKMRFKPLSCRLETLRVLIVQNFIGIVPAKWLQQDFKFIPKEMIFKGNLLKGFWD